MVYVCSSGVKWVSLKPIQMQHVVKMIVLPRTAPANHDNGKLLRAIEIHVNPRIQSCLYLIRKRLSYKTTFISYSEKTMLKDRKSFRKA